MSELKAIPTRYRGYHFRSRLEARWAVFFDEMGIYWQYETSGYKIENRFGDEPEYWNWLPDFYLPTTKTWVEVKGDFSRINGSLLTHAIDYGGQIPDVGDSGETERGILLLGDIPNPPRQCELPGWDSEFVAHPIIQHSSGVVTGMAAFGFGWGESRMREFGFLCRSSDYVYDAGGEQMPAPKMSHVTWPIAYWNWLRPLKHSGYHLSLASAWQAKAYATARSARFEHGESGAT